MSNPMDELEHAGACIPPVAPALGPRSAISLPETVPPLHGRSLAVAPSDRQRTIQACDKCRERKTKCSGKHPVCHRCKMRGLVCQYSSREPRSRGPTRARLRNAISSMELRIPSSPHDHIHSPPDVDLELLPQPLRRFNSHYDDPIREYPTLGELTTTPRSFHGDSEPYKVSPTTSNFELAHETLTQPSGYSHTISTALHSPPHLNQINRPPQWRDVRRVQSHSALIGPTGGGMDGNRMFKYQNINSLDDHSESTSYRQWPTQGHVSSPPVIFDSFAHFAPSSAPVGLQMPYHHSPSVHAWNYSDGGSTGSEPMSSGELVLGYSPSSSDDVPEPLVRTSSMGVVPIPESHQHAHMGHNFSEYVPYQEREFSNNYWAVPSREAGGSKLYQTQGLAQSDSLVRQGIVTSMITSDSDSGMPLGYPSTYP